MTDKLHDPTWFSLNITCVWLLYVGFLNISIQLGLRKHHVYVVRSIRTFKCFTCCSHHLCYVLLGSNTVYEHSLTHTHLIMSLQEAHVTSRQSVCINVCIEFIKLFNLECTSYFVLVLHMCQLACL